MTVTEVEMAQRGQVTMPKALREQYGLQAGQEFTLLDLGGTFLLNPKGSRVDALCDQLRDGLMQSGGTLESMLAEIRRMRENDAAAQAESVSG